MEFDEIPRFWYPRVALDTWIDFSSRTFELRPSECRENLLFLFSSFLPLSIHFLPLCTIFPFLFFFGFPHFSLFDFPSRIDQKRGKLPLTFLPSLTTSHLSHFLLISLSLFSFLSFLFWSYLIPPNCLFCLLQLSIFFLLIFRIFLSYYFLHLHLAQCEPFIQVHHMAYVMCHSPRLSCDIHMIMSCVTNTQYLEKVKFRLSRNPTKFDGVTKFHETNSTVKSVSSFEI